MLPKVTGHGSHFEVPVALTAVKLALSCYERSIGFMLVSTAILVFELVFCDVKKNANVCFTI